MGLFNLIKSFMSKTEQNAGVYAVDMSVADLKQLCKENNLDIKGLTKKEDILKVVHKWEKKMQKATEVKLEGVGATLSIKNVVSEPIELEFYEGKKVKSKKDIVLNGKEYTDILVDGGITHRVLK